MFLEVTNCCGFNLKNGTIIIGVLQGITFFMFLILSAVYADNPHELLAMSNLTVPPDSTVLKTVLIIVAVMCALQCIFSIMIIFGAVTNNPALLVPWLIFNLGILALFTLSVLFKIGHRIGSDTTIVIISHLVLGLIMILIFSYKILVVHNFFKHLKSLNF